MFRQKSKSGSECRSRKSSLRSKLAALIMALATLLAAETSQASVCHDLGGSIIFRDTLYGLGTGVVLTGLGLIVVGGRGENTGRNLAAGSLVGAGVGTMFGFVESFSRPGCDAPAREANSREAAAAGQGATFLAADSAPAAPAERRTNWSVQPFVDLGAASRSGEARSTYGLTAQISI